VATDVLDQVSLGSSFDRLEQLVRRVMDGQDDDHDLWVRRFQSSGSSDAVLARHIDVHQDQVQRKERRPCHGGLRITWLANDDKVVLIRKEASQSFAEQGMIV
jgi:hypothetical protein